MILMAMTKNPMFVCAEREGRGRGGEQRRKETVSQKSVN